MLIATCGVLVSNVAWADPSPTPTRIPIELVTNGSSRQVAVVRGDHLWKISERHLDQALRRKARNSEIAPFWRDVIETNLPNLRSGDPDLIYPGELIELPEFVSSGQP